MERGRWLSRYSLFPRSARRGEGPQGTSVFLGGRLAALLTHSLDKKVREGTQQYGSLIDLLADARTLDLHYIPSRYPNGLPSGYPHQFYAPEMSGQAISACGRIVTTVSELLRQHDGQDVVAEES